MDQGFNTEKDIGVLKARDLMPIHMLRLAEDARGGNVYISRSRHERRVYFSDAKSRE
jgi:hypothetical protein